MLPISLADPCLRLPSVCRLIWQADVWMSGPYHITNVTFYARVPGVAEWSDWFVIGTALSIFLDRTKMRVITLITVIAEADSGALGEDLKWMQLYRVLSLAFAAPDANKPVAVGMPVALQLSCMTRDIFC